MRQSHLGNAEDIFSNVQIINSSVGFVPWFVHINVHRHMI